MIGEESRAMKIATALREQGIFIPAIRFPTVAHGQARLRVTLSATHQAEDIARLLVALQSALNFKP
jgi:7-keto-8-aminopelargonate synthetase-like enzyme